MKMDNTYIKVNNGFFFGILGFLFLVFNFSEGEGGSGLGWVTF